MSKTDEQKIDLEREASFNSSLNSKESANGLLRIQAEKNPHYVHDLTGGEADRPDVRLEDSVVDRTTFLICRALVGMFEADYIPGIAIYLTTYYKKDEMATRLSIFWSTLAIANSVAGVLAYGILHMRGVGHAGWRWLFLFEDLITVLIGLLSFFIVPEEPTATKGGLRFNGYLSDRQEHIAITRLIRDDPSKVDTRKGVVSKKHLDESSSVAQYLDRAAWIAGNTAPVGKRSIALAMYIISVNACDMVSVNLFRDEDTPRFITGFWILFGALLLTTVLFILQRYHLTWIKGNDHLSFRYSY
ncbi:hypothetical protein BGZ65_010439 [Modicella reniformis]|uniref:Major facilitator superfamily (MFS) profile domain-containing protein n=1 Tax=Modicella reniformis TaxID=1440133 RepID=A0A9P6LTY5_9FUNG|nr:hypothetical protein BGZ65_010439 [Modicella reniformis]